MKYRHAFLANHDRDQIINGHDLIIIARRLIIIGQDLIVHWLQSNYNLSPLVEPLHYDLLDLGRGIIMSLGNGRTKYLSMHKCYLGS